MLVTADLICKTSEEHGYSMVLCNLEERKSLENPIICQG